VRGERGSAAAGEDGNKTHPPSPPPRYSTLAGYKFNIAALRRVFSPTFILRGVRQTGPRELTTRWTMRMRVAALPASIAPALAFTGTSVMRVDAEGKFCYHADTWDAVTNQAYFSAEAAAHVARQVATLARPPAAVAVAAGDLLRKAAKFEVRRFETPLRVASCAAGGGAGFAAFKPLVDYITDRGVAMTTPVLSGGGAMRFVLPSDGAPPPPPAPDSGITLADLPAGDYACGAFTGFAGDAAAARAESRLRADLAAAGLSVAPDATPFLAVYNGPDTLLPPARLNEVWLRLQDFDLWA